MLLCWNRFAAVAAVVAVQASVYPALAVEEEGQVEGSEEFMNGFRRGLMASGLMSGDFFGEGSFMQVPSLFDFFRPFQQFSGAPGATLNMYLDKEDEKSCQVVIEAPEFVKTSDLELALHPESRMITASFKSEQKQEHKDPKRGLRIASRTMQGASSIGLPERCMATPAVLMSHLGGAVLAGDSNKSRRALLVLPSQVALEEHVREKRLPDGIVETIEKGDEAGKARLSEEQLCLAAGFTQAQCKKLGDKKPSVAFVPSTGAASGGIPFPVYATTLEELE